MNRHLGQVIVGIVIAAGCASAYFVWSRLPGNPNEAAEHPDDRAEATPIVRLTDAKREAAGIRVAKIEKRAFQSIHQVPARLQYDDTRHVEIKAPADGVLQAYRVKPGDQVAQGQVLAILSSSEIGLARADVSRRRSDVQLADRQFQWRHDTDQNVQQLVREIRRQRESAELESQFRDRQLGEFREVLLSAYSRWLLAEAALASIQAASDTGALAARTRRERASERQTAEAALRSACERTAFDSQHQSATAEANLQDAQRRLDIARQHLQTLLGYEDDPNDKKADSPPADTASGANLSLVESRAPFAGTIESRRFAASERVKQGDTLLVLADTARLWVVADIREKDWEALRLSEDQEMKLEIPSLPDQKFVARLYYLGREVTPGTNAIPLVATINNSHERLRPGLFARLSIAVGEPRECLMVPTSAVVQHEGDSFVFVADSANAYRRVDIETGEQNDEWIEITGGPAEGSPVVVEGAFILKSELLLEREE